MFLFKQSLIREACLFNLMNARHMQSYNALLAEEGRTLFVQRRKEWGVTGFVSMDVTEGFDPDSPPAMQVKDDAFYLYLEYDKTPSSPWVPPNRAEMHGQNIYVSGKNVTKDVIIDVVSEEMRALSDPNHVVIDISSRMKDSPKRAKKSRTAKEAVDKAIAKNKATDITSKQISKAKTIDEKIEVAAGAGVRKMQDQANKEALEQLKDVAKDAANKAAKAITAKMKGSVGVDGMTEYLADEIRTNPKEARKIIAKMIKESPEKWPGMTVDTLCSKILDMSNRVTKPIKKKLDPVELIPEAKKAIAKSSEAKKKGDAKPAKKRPSARPKSKP